MNKAELDYTTFDSKPPRFCSCGSGLLITLMGCRKCFCADERLIAALEKIRDSQRASTNSLRLIAREALTPEKKT